MYESKNLKNYTFKAYSSDPNKRACPNKRAGWNLDKN